MKYYCETIPVTLAEKLKEKGMPITYSNHPHQIAPGVRGIVLGNFKEIDCPTFGACFDWLMERGIILYLDATYKHWFWRIETKEGIHQTEEFESWHEAANAAIKKALELIK